MEQLPKIKKPYDHNAYRAANKDAINARKVIWRQNNPTNERETATIYRNTLVICECGETVKRGALSNHKKSQYHIAFVTPSLLGEMDEFGNFSNYGDKK